MAITAQDLEHKYNQRHSLKQSRRIESYSIVADANYELHRRESHPIPPYYTLKRADGTNEMLGRMDEGDIALGLTKLQRLTFSDHVAAVQDPRWRVLYDRRQRPIPFVDNAGQMTVRPHSLGLRLTKEAAQGHKNVQANNLSMGNIGALTPVPVREYDWAATWTRKYVGDPRPPRTYRLTQDGLIFLTAGLMVFGQTAFEKLCVNSILNLVPSCARCNGSAGKHTKLFATIAG